MDRKPVARTKCIGKVPFIARWAKGGWNGWGGSALVASARSCLVSSACTESQGGWRTRDYPCGAGW
jgi:hypothetical protein